MHIGGVGVVVASHDAQCRASLVLAISLIHVQYSTIHDKSTAIFRKSSSF